MFFWPGTFFKMTQMLNSTVRKKRERTRDIIDSSREEPYSQTPNWNIVSINDFRFRTKGSYILTATKTPVWSHISQKSMMIRKTTCCWNTPNPAERSIREKRSSSDVIDCDWKMNTPFQDSNNVSHIAKSDRIEVETSTWWLSLTTRRRKIRPGLMTRQAKDREPIKDRRSRLRHFRRCFPQEEI